MKPRLTTDEMDKIWQENFEDEFQSLPEGRKGNCPEKKELYKKIFAFEQDGKVFSFNYIAKLMDMNHSTILYHYKRVDN